MWYGPSSRIHDYFGTPSVIEVRLRIDDVKFNNDSKSMSLDTLEALDYEVNDFRETLELSSAATIVSIGSVGSTRLNATCNVSCLILVWSLSVKCREEIRIHEDDKRDKFR